MSRYVTILRAHSTAVSVTTSFAVWSCCGCVRRSPTLECILKALCSRVGKNTHTIAYLASSLEPHAPPIVWQFAEINHYVGLRSDTNIPCRDHLWPLPGLLIINIHFTQCYARYYPYFTCR